MKRRKASKSLLDNAPDVQLDSHLSSIASVRSAVEAACRDEGTTFNSLGNFDYNSFYVPLLAIAEQMKALMWAVDRWAFRAKYMRHIDSELSYIYKNEAISDKLRFAKISHRLRRCSPYDSSYCRVFRSVITHLNLLEDAGFALIKFLSLICAEGNCLPFDRPLYPREWDREVTDRSETLSNFFSSTLEPDHPSSPKNLASSIGLTSATPSLHQATPTWKLSLAHKYSTEQLYVGAAELQVFANTLCYARLARRELIVTRRTISDIAALADGMQRVFDKWAGRCEMWESESIDEAENVTWEDENSDDAGQARM